MWVNHCSMTFGSFSIAVRIGVNIYPTSNARSQLSAAKDKLIIRALWRRLAIRLRCRSRYQKLLIAGDPFHKKRAGARGGVGV